MVRDMDGRTLFAGNLITDNIKYIDAYPAPTRLANITGSARS